MKELLTYFCFHFIFSFGFNADENVHTLTQSEESQSSEMEGGSIPTTSSTPVSKTGPRSTRSSPPSQRKSTSSDITAVTPENVVREKRKIVRRDSHNLTKRIKTLTATFGAVYNDIMDELNQRVEDADEFNEALDSIEQREMKVKEIQKEFNSEFKQRFSKMSATSIELKKVKSELETTLAELANARAEIETLKSRIVMLEAATENDQSDDVMVTYEQFQQDVYRKYDMEPYRKTDYAGSDSDCENAD